MSAVETRQQKNTLLFYFSLSGLPKEQSKKESMPVGVPSARYSLVKGERIVRPELSSWLRSVKDGYGVIYSFGVAKDPVTNTMGQ
jgi:hypothetical protein